MLATESASTPHSPPDRVAYRPGVAMQRMECRRNVPSTKRTDPTSLVLLGPEMRNRVGMRSPVRAQNGAADTADREYRLDR